MTDGLAQPLLRRSGSNRTQPSCGLECHGGWLERRVCHARRDLIELLRTHVGHGRDVGRIDPAVLLVEGPDRREAYEAGHVLGRARLVVGGRVEVRRLRTP